MNVLNNNNTLLLWLKHTNNSWLQSHVLLRVPIQAHERRPDLLLVRLHPGAPAPEEARTRVPAGAADPEPVDRELAHLEGEGVVLRRGVVAAAPGGGGGGGEGAAVGLEALEDGGLVGRGVQGRIWKKKLFGFNLDRD